MKQLELSKVKLEKINSHKYELGGALTPFICKRIDSWHHDESGKQFSLYKQTYESFQIMEQTF